MSKEYGLSGFLSLTLDEWEKFCKDRHAYHAKMEALGTPILKKPTLSIEEFAKKQDEEMNRVIGSFDEELSKQIK